MKKITSLLISISFVSLLSFGILNQAYFNGGDTPAPAKPNLMHSDKY
ncbi:Phr family secreted Rap phosphatase inhibitor [Bacillus clarus]|uniref:Phr family secreted Rap phosphatase inhibitor n=1 Tax=Bacillus clarus TaxID=2338372 RepID=A0ABX9KME1_9BACI|nr:Phr family secreted Rap phosphatase inhibitor [Bacillus clarus]